MTAERIRAHQAIRPPKGTRLLRGTVSALSPLTVQIAGGTAVAGIAIPGAIYAVGDAVLISWQEPGVGPVFPLLTSPNPVPATTGTFSYSGTAADWDGNARRTSVTRQGALGLLNLQATLGATPPAYGATFATIASGFRPARVVNLDVVLFNGGWNNQRATVDIEPDGTINIPSSTTPLTANAGIFGSIPLPLI